MEPSKSTFTAFVGENCIAEGPLEAVVRLAKEVLDTTEGAQITLFDDQTGRGIDLDYRGTPDEVVARLAEHPLFARPATEAETKPSGPGRPRLGVVSREVTLLPRHWDWLADQRGGASATLRRLVDDARRKEKPNERARKAREAVHYVMWHLAGSFPDFEEVTRAFDRRERSVMVDLMSSWPEDVRKYIERLVERADTLEKVSHGTPDRSAGER